MTELRFNRVFPSRYNFLVGSNLTNFFAIGEFVKKDDFYMVGLHQQDGSILINTNLYASTGKLLFALENGRFNYNWENSFMYKTTEDSKHGIDSVEVTDNKMVPIYAKRTFRPVLTGQGPIEISVTEILGKFYNKSAELVAEGSREQLILHKTKSIIGAAKTGSLGFVLGCNDAECSYVRDFVKTHLP
jgi:uncharacterized protein YegP (UPF0339 family)